MTEEVHHAASLQEGFQVGDYYVEPDLQRITGKGRDVRVEPKVMDVLVLLARRAGRAVTKDAFMDEVWADTIVSNDALLRCISELRRLFDDDPQQPRYIETIRKRGYRLIAPVSPGGDGSVGETPRAAHAGTAPHAPSTSGGGLRWGWIGERNLIGLLTMVGLVAVVLAVVLIRTDAIGPPAPLNAVPLTSLIGVESDPNLSPDGLRMAFVWDGGANGNFDIYVKQIGVETPLRMTSSDEDERSPSWSPDGQQIAYVRNGLSGSGLYVVPMLGGSPRQVADLSDRAINAVAWSPDGRTLAFTVERTPHGAFGVWTLSLETSEMRQLTQPPADFRGDYELAFSPDGSYLAFVRGVVERVDDIYVVPSAGGEARRLTFDHAEITGLDWRQSGREIIFSSDREGAFALWSISTEGGSPQWIPTGALGSGVHQPSVARSAGGLAYIQRQLEINVWRFDLQQGTDGQSASGPHVVVSSTRWDSNPDVSPRGDRIAFASNRSGSYEIWISNADGSNPVQITHLDGPFANTPRWSPNGSAIAFAARDEGSVDIYVVDVTGGTPRRLTSAASNDQAPNWSPDGRSIYFGSNRSGTWQVWRIPASGGDAVQVTFQGGYAAAEANGEVYFVKRDVPGIWRIEDGSELRLIPNVQPYDWGNWAVAPDGLYFVRRDGNAPRVARYAFDTRAIEDVGIVAAIPRHPAMALAPGGTYVLLSRTDRIEADVHFVRGFN